MNIVIARKTSAKTGNKYLVMEARADWGTVSICYETAKILQLIPRGYDHRDIDEKGIVIGHIDE